MKGYSFNRVFSTYEISLRALAEKCVEAIPDDNENALRCHEVARAVGSTLGLDHQDGHYGAVDHTWLIVPHPTRGGGRCILDAYCIGRLPMVQLIEVQSCALPHRAEYREGPDREDVRIDVVIKLANIMREALR